MKTNKFVEELKWLDESEMLDISAIAQSSPGPIPINASVILGYRMCGIPGSLIAILGTALPPMIIISVISYFYVQFRSNQILGCLAVGILDLVFQLKAERSTGHSASCSKDHEAAAVTSDTVKEA